MYYGKEYKADLWALHVLPGRLYSNTTSSGTLVNSYHFRHTPNNWSSTLYLSLFLVWYLIPSFSVVGQIDNARQCLTRRKRNKKEKTGKAREESEKKEAAEPCIATSFDLYRRVYRMTARINHPNGGIDEPIRLSGERMRTLGPNSTGRMNAREAES